MNLILQALKSKTIKLAILAIGGGIVAYIQGQVVAGGAITIYGIVSIILRILTTQPLNEK